MFIHKKLFVLQIESYFFQSFYFFKLYVFAAGIDESDPVGLCNFVLLADKTQLLQRVACDHLECGICCFELVKRLWYLKL